MFTVEMYVRVRRACLAEKIGSVAAIQRVRPSRIERAFSLNIDSRKPPAEPPTCLILPPPLTSVIVFLIWRWRRPGAVSWTLGLLNMTDLPHEAGLRPSRIG